MSLVGNFPNRIESFIKAANKNGLKMILVGGGAVNFYGYQRHSADLDFWIDIQPENLNNLLLTLQHLGYKIEHLPEDVKSGEQNISIKISPVFDLELITKFHPNISFADALIASERVENNNLVFNVLSFNDLIQSKISSSRAKDKLDVEELHKIQLQKKNEG